jgi:hypothetical protein
MEVRRTTTARLLEETKKGMAIMLSKIATTVEETHRLLGLDRAVAIARLPVI